MYFNEHQHPFGPERRVNRRQLSTLSPIGHWLWYCPPRSRLFESTFLRSLRSTPVTELHRYYGRSDSCLLGSSGPWSMNSDSFHKQVSLIHASGLPDHSVSKHLTHSRRRFSRYPSAPRASLFRWVLDFAFRTQARHLRPAESSLLSYGLVVHLLLLPTPPRGDAVAVGYRPESVYLKRTFTSPTTRAFQAHVRKASGLPARSLQPNGLRPD